MKTSIFLDFKKGICLLAGLLILVSCAQKKEPVSKSTAQYTVQDDLGRTVQLPRQPRRVLALAPSMTEMLFAIAPDSLIIGRTQNCNYPLTALKKPVVNTYPLDLEALLALQPDLVLTVEGMTSLESAQRIEKLGIPVYFQRYNKVEDIVKGIEDLGRLLHLENIAQQVSDSLQKELSQLQQLKASGKPTTVVALAWQDPIMVYGRNTLFTDKLRYINAVNAVDTAFANPYPPVTREYLLKLNPDVLFSRSFAEMDTTFFKRYHELKKLKAYRTRKVYALTPDLMERPNPRVVTSIAEIRKYLP